MLLTLQYFNDRSDTLVLFNMHPLLPEPTLLLRSICDSAYAAQRFYFRFFFLLCFVYVSGLIMLQESK